MVMAAGVFVYLKSTVAQVLFLYEVLKNDYHFVLR
jgi:hypothetical protein